MTETSSSTTQNGHAKFDDTELDHDNDMSAGLNLDEFISQQPANNKPILSKSKLSEPISDEVVENNSRSVGSSTDTEDLATVEPGTNILLEGIIWNETTKGVLILNVNWRGKI